MLKNGVPEDRRLQPDRDQFWMPVMLPFPRRSLLLLKASGTVDVQVGVELMQSVMLRILAMPPARSRLHDSVDPVGIGQQFLGLHASGRLRRKLVASRIGPTPSHIEQHLVDLTKHMETVLQVYLRREFHSIEAYNDAAGEMAEPFRVLVVANFPANFYRRGRATDQKHRGQRPPVRRVCRDERRHEGRRCRGNCQMADLENNGMVLHWTDGHFAWHHPAFKDRWRSIFPSRRRLIDSRT